MTQPKLRDQAYDAFARHLLDGALEPGQFVTQRELAAMTSMSLGAIREMIPRLEAEGLIKAISQRGLQIVHVDLKMVVDAFQLREMIELSGVEEFCKRASDARVMKLYNKFHDLKERAKTESPTASFLKEAQATDWEMHDAFVAALDNELISNIYRVNSIKIRMILGNRIGLPPQRLPVALQEHEAVLEAVRNRDVAAANKALKAHLRSSQRRSLAKDAFDETQTIIPDEIS